MIVIIVMIMMVAVSAVILIMATICMNSIIFYYLFSLSTLTTYLLNPFTGTDRDKCFDEIIEAFKARGLKTRIGSWVVSEKKQIHQNFADFVKTHEDIIGNPVDFIVTSYDKTRAKEVMW